jgi:hypothetical protein
MPVSADNSNRTTAGNPFAFLSANRSARNRRQRHPFHPIDGLRASSAFWARPDVDLEHRTAREKQIVILARDFIESRVSILATSQARDSMPGLRPISHRKWAVGNPRLEAQLYRFLAYGVLFSAS